MTITRTNCLVEVAIEANGMTWRFGHARSTPADAANLKTLVKQAVQEEQDRKGHNTASLYVRINRLERANAALRGHLRRAKRGGAS